MQRNIVETVLGAVVLLVAAGFLLYFSRATEIRAAEGGYNLTANFSSVDGLQTGAPVRVSGVKVGQVTGFRLDTRSYAAIVTMNINEGVKLPKDTSAVVASAGLLDGKFMTLQPGSEDDLLKGGDRIEYTQSTPSLEQLLGQVIFSLNKDKDDSKKGGGKKAPEPGAAKSSAPAGP
jgi:phospholipid/cholesterol/gamma-HCH transport system substrate-binding protein